MRAASTGGPAPGWRRCRCSARSRSGSGLSRSAPTGGPGGWGTAGSRKERRARRAAGRAGRAGGRGDGWSPQVPPGPRLDEARGVFEQAAREAGRDPAAIGMEGRVSWHGDPGPVAELAARWRGAGATHLSVNTMGAGLRDLEEHLGALEAAAKVLKPGGE